MSLTESIRRYRPGEETALFSVFYSAVHQIASRDYSTEQVQAWAPEDMDADLWAARIREINPFVAELDGKIVGYADLQANGYIDHFFVSGEHARRGVGTALMQHLIREAKAAGLTEMTSHVSRTAQAFFESFGFIVVEQRLPELRGVFIPNAVMKRVVC